MKILKLYAFILISLFCLDTALPHNQAFAWFHGMSIQTNANSCGVTNNNWCVGIDGWTAFTANNATGTCPGTDTTTGPCFIAVDNSTASSYTGHIAVSPTLVIDSAVGTSPSVGQTVVRADGTRLGTITSGSYPNFTLAGSGSTTFTAESMTSSLGNDTTCALGAPPTAVYSSLSLSSYVPSKPCYSQSTAFGKQRLVNPKTWVAAFSGIFNGTTLTTSGNSGDPLYVGAILGGGTLASNSFTGQMSGTTTLTVTGTPPNNNDQVFRASGTYLGYVVSGGGTSTPVLSASATFGPEASMTSAAWAVVTAQNTGSQGGAGTYTVYPSQTNGTTAASGTLKRITATRDWFLTKKGTTWNGMIGGGNWNANGWSPVDLNVIATYGTGARPQFLSVDGSGQNCFNAAVSRGYQMAVVGYNCYNQLIDPNSASYLGFTITADAGTTATAPCATAATICNTTVPAAVQANPTRYKAYGTGVNFFSVTAATATTITLASNALTPTTASSGPMKIQITNTANAGGMTWAEFDTLIVEDNRIDFGLLAPNNTSNFPTDIPNERLRRNVLWNQTTLPFGGGNTGQSYNQFGGTIVYEENFIAMGGWNPQIWGAGGANGTHSAYMHNPSPPVNWYSNIWAYNPSDNQYRDAGTAYNNLFLYQASGGGSANTGIQDNPLNYYYNVNQNSYNIPAGTRTASVLECSGSGTPGYGCSILHIDGIFNTGASINFTAENVTNLSNPGSIPTNCKTSGIRDAVSVNLNCTLAAGIRGNGVQIGDILRLYENGGTGILVQGLGQFVSNQPNGTQQYPIYSNVSVSNLSPSVVTDTASRSIGEPFSFTPVILTGAGSGYGASATGTLTWAGTGCTVNPVINVSTNAAGNVIAFNSITTPGTCGTPPAAGNASWSAGGGLNVGGTGVTLAYNMSMGTLPTGVSLASATGGACTGSLVANPNTGQTVCTYYALANGTSYQFSATSGGAAINASGSSGTTIQRTGSALFMFSKPFAPIYTPGVPAGVTVGTPTYVDINTIGFAGPNGKTTVQSLSGDRFTLITDDASINIVNSFGSTQYTFIFGLPGPCSINPSCASPVAVGPNNIFSHSVELNGANSAAIYFNRLSAGYNGGNNYIFNWNASSANNLTDIGFAGANTLVGAQVLNANTGYANTTGANSLKANIEYYDASQIEASNTFSGYIDNGAGANGYILTITSGTPPLAMPTNANGGYGDTIFDTTATANVVAQYTQIVAQIDATHYLVNAPSGAQKVGSSGSPQQMMYGSADRFLAKAATQSRDTGWIYAYTAEAANDYIRSQLGCGNQSVFGGSPTCPSQGQTIH